MVKLTPTARVILGMLKLGARTGYDIKRVTEFSTRFFWSASYGQIYPELRKLEQRGLIEGEHDPRGAVARRAYRLTAAGEAALHEWLTDRENWIFDFRDEMLLRLFFGDLIAREEVLANVQATREWWGEIAGQFRAIEVEALEDAQEGRVFPLTTLRFGIGFADWISEWYGELEHRLRAGDPPTPVETSQSSS
jgi:PadR family transcriptional regulator, regulatory protein AphA